MEYISLIMEYLQISKVYGKILLFQVQVDMDLIQLMDLSY